MSFSLISNPTNIFYICGFRGLSPDEREGWLLCKPDGDILITDRRYQSAAESLLSHHENLVIEFLSPKNRLRDIITRHAEGAGEVLGFEAEDLRHAEFLQLKKALKGIKLKPIPHAERLVNVRRTKTSHEVQLIRKACETTDQCLKEIVTHITSSIQNGETITEKDVADMISQWADKHECELAFYPIVSGQPHAAEAHYDTRQHGSKNIIKNDSYLLIDMGLRIENYCADITRMIAIGTPPLDHQKAHQDLLEIQQNAIKKLKSIKTYKKLDIWVRKQLTAKGYPEFSHALGHGVGLEVHEMPSVSMRSKDKIAPGDVITIEPGIYEYGKFGMRIEDTVWINEKEEPLVLTQTEY